MHNASGKGCGHRRDIAQRQSPDTLCHHRRLYGEGRQRQAHTDIGELLDRPLFLLGLGTEDLGDEVKDWCNRGATTPKKRCIFRLLDIAMVRCGRASLDPLHGGAQQYDSLCGPLADATRFGVAVICGYGLGVEVLHEGNRLLIDDVAFSNRSGFNLDPCGKAYPVVDHVET